MSGGVVVTLTLHNSNTHIRHKKVRLSVWALCVDLMGSWAGRLMGWAGGPFPNEKRTQSSCVLEWRSSSTFLFSFCLRR